jgi:acyl transferase domain-containing protein
MLVFESQESDFIGVSEKLCWFFLLFHHHLDQCNNILILLGFKDLYPAIFQHMPISNLITLHFTLFSVQYFSAKAWMDCGLEVSTVIGHSFGQLTVLCISGCLSLEDALMLVTGRAFIILRHWGSEWGSMICLQTNLQNVSEILKLLKAWGNGDDLKLPVTTVQITVLSLALPIYWGLRDICHEHYIASRFSSYEEIECYAQISFQVYRYSVASSHCFDKKSCVKTFINTSGDLQCWSELGWTGFSAGCRAYETPVFFDQAVKRLTQRYFLCTWLKAGHESSIIQLIQDCLAANQDLAHIFLSPRLTTSDAECSLAEITVNLWKAGYAAQYWLFHQCHKQQYRFLALPPYQFKKSQHWLPFSERVKNRAPPDPVQAMHKCELLSFVKFKDDSKNEAIFRVDSQSDRYQSLLKGHVMAGQAVVPASLYFELVARAAMSLQSDLASTSYVPCVKSLEMKSPIGLDSNKDILLSLTCIKTRDSPGHSLFQPRHSQILEVISASLVNIQREQFISRSRMMFKRLRTSNSSKHWSALIIVRRSWITPRQKECKKIISIRHSIRLSTMVNNSEASETLPVYA